MSDLFKFLALMHVTVCDDSLAHKDMLPECDYDFLASLLGNSFPLLNRENASLMMAESFSLYQHLLLLGFITK